MPASLERDLGLYATVTISMGAMIGSGIFVLPGLAFGIAGPAVVLAYFLAGLLVLPAALSKAEMATAMPEAGGTYLYIDRAMGPLHGTVAGVGAWFSLVFKSAFALIGLGAYLLIVVDLPATVVGVAAIAIAALLLVVNVVGVKQSGRLQATVVSLVVLALVGFVLDGLTWVHQPNYHPFYPDGVGAVVAATGFVFVSYAGVTKIASIAEEVENPGRNIPIAILGSVLVMMVIYSLVVFVVVGVAPAAELGDTKTPMALAAGAFAGPVGKLAISVVAILALTSMANAGILSATRFPLAMSRDGLAPTRLQRVDDRFGTPVASIALTGVLLVGLIAVFPVRDLAKLASAFKILVFAFVNLALVAFRESDLRSYDPDFVAPGYPWVQLIGIVGGAVLLVQLGPKPIAGAAVMTLIGIAWYALYGRDRTEREGAALDAIRRRTDAYSVSELDDQFTTGGEGGALVVVDADVDAAREATLLAVARSIVARRGGQVHLARFRSVPEQVTLSSAAEDEGDPRPPALAMGDDASEHAVPTTVDDVVVHDVPSGVVNHLDRTGANLLVGAVVDEPYGDTLLGHDLDWYLEHVDADVAAVRDRGLDDVETVVVASDQGPLDPLAVLVADAVAFEHDATIRFCYPLATDASDEQHSALEEYHESVEALCTVPTERRVLRTDDPVAAITDAASDADLAVVGRSAHNVVTDVVFGVLPDDVADRLDCTVVLVRSNRPRRHTFIRYLLDRFVF